MNPAPSTYELYDSYIAKNWHRFPVSFARGDGVYLFDENGRRYLDFVAGFSSSNYGYCHPRFVLAAIKQLLRGPGNIPNIYHIPEQAKLAQKLIELTGLKKVLFRTTGAEAVEVAIKAARKWGYLQRGVAPRKAEIIVPELGYHGTTYGAFSASRLKRSPYFDPPLEGFVSIPFGDTRALAKAITENTVAFLTEPIQALGGINIPPDGFLADSAGICREYNILFMVDEIFTGLCRTGTMFAYQREKILPDIVCVGKALSGGVGTPVSAAIMAEKADILGPGDDGGTFDGNPLACAVACEAIDLAIEERFAERAETYGLYFVELLRKIKSPLIREVRGRGLLIGVEINRDFTDARTVCKKLLEAGLLAKDALAGNVVRFIPPLIISMEEINEALTIIEQTLKAWR